MKRLRSIGNKIAPIVFILILLIIWEIIVNVGGIEKYILPAPTDVIEVLIKDFKTMIPHILATLYEGMVGFLIAIALSIILAVIMDMVPLIKELYIQCLLFLKLYQQLLLHHYL